MLGFLRHPNLRSFGDNSHGRFVRFGRYVWELDNGLDIFEGAKVGTLAKQHSKRIANFIVSAKPICGISEEREKSFSNAEPRG